MKLLLFSDLHINIKKADALVRKSEDIDLVIGAGDFATVHRGLNEIMDHLKSISKPSFLVPGNGETYEELVEAARVWQSATVLHGMGTTRDGYSIFGIGGGIPVTPFGSWSYDFTEQEAEDLLKECPDKAILISHSPPKGIVDRASSGLHLGSTTLRNIISEKKPLLVVCGHIHESAGKSERVEDTLVVNAGPDGIMVDMDML